ncbi:MAG: HD domain-containing protein [Syntrophobacterales bacterium]|nr:HD domain-containing protein [Syntrophobacterales bacterium]
MSQAEPAGKSATPAVAGKGKHCAAAQRIPETPPGLPVPAAESSYGETPAATEPRGLKANSQRLLVTMRQAMQALVHDDGPSPEEKGALLYDLLLAWTRQFYDTPECRSGPLLDLARDLVGTLYRLLAAAPHLGLLALSFRRLDAGLAGHCLNVCLLALGYARHNSWPETAARTLGLGALLHDLGMTALPGAWEKSGPLSGDELELLRRHPQGGVQLLKPFPLLPGKVFLMVAQHHENADGSGYPLGLPLAAIHPYARLLRILDTFEALTSLRPWRPPLSPAKALGCMLYSGANGTEFDLRLLQQVRRFLDRLLPHG